MNAFALSGRLLLRQGRSGTLWMLLAGLVVATAALAAVGLFTDRVGRALERQAAEIIAADVLLRDRAPIPKRYADAARELGLETSRTIELSSVLFSPTTSALFSVKGVAEGYPLRGAVQIATSTDAVARAATGIPAPGTAWIAPEGLRSLGIAVGDTVTLGTRELEITDVLTWEPDRGGSPFMLTPRLMVHLADVEGSGLLGPGARATWRLLMAGDERAVERFVERFEPGPAGRLDLDTPGEEQAETDEALEQARRFLSVAALTAVILAAVAVLLAARRFSAGQRDLVAVLKAFGAESGEIMRAVSLMLVWIALLAIVAGAVLGLAGQQLIASILAGQMRVALPAPDLGPLWTSAAFTLLMTAGFALPPLLALKSVPPMRILNRSLDRVRFGQRAGWLVPVVAALALPAWQLGDARLALTVLGGSLAMAALLALSALGAIALTRRLAERASGAWRFGLAGLGRRRTASVVQITALGLGLMALLLLAVVRGELIGQWQATLPADAPDHFMVNIQPDQVERVRARLAAIGVGRLQIRPMANVQLIAIDGDDPPEHRFTGQVNVSWIDSLPPANEVIAGRFWTPGASGELSVAKRWSDRVGVKLGDTMTFDAGGQRFSAHVTSIRNVQWNSFNVNFFLLLTPDAGRALPHQYVASFHLPAAAGGALDELSRELANVTVLDVGALIQRVFEIITQVSRAAQVVFAFTLIAGLIVLLAALEATRDERRAEAALIRTLGAGNRTVRDGLLIEYTIIALIAALLATLGAALTGWLLATELFGFDYRPGWLLFAGGFVASAVLVIGAGWLGNRSVLATPPMRILRAG